MDDLAAGTPFSPALRAEADEWSLQVFDLLSSWASAFAGEWTIWEPGYLVLKISKAGGSLMEPIVLATADQELTITFGHCEAHLPTSFDADAKQAVHEAKELVRRWLSGEIRTAVFTDVTGKMVREHADRGRRRPAAAQVGMDQ